MSAQYDVVIVGSGPVGMAAAGLLAQRGFRVCIVERYAGLYNLPRAANFDGETMRVFDRLGIADDLLPVLHFEPHYEWRNSAGDLLLEIRYDERGVSGWADFYQMYQPDVEEALFTAATSFGVEFRFGEEVTGYTQHSASVEITTSVGVLTASFVIACDGGNGMTRRAIGSDIIDLDFSVPWLVCDFEYRVEKRDVPRALQVGNPAQPVSIIALGHHHQRFSYMLDWDADFDVEKAPEAVWARVSDYLRPGEADLIRSATYTFRSLLADRWRNGRIFLAGDAAHQMPPFLGQGMVSGIRDAQNLAFKIDLVLRGLARESILDSYQSERFPHVDAILRRAVALGRIQTTRDPVAAAARDAKLLAERQTAPEPQTVSLPPLGPGISTARSDGAKLTIMPQGRLSDGTTVGVLDRWVDAKKFVLILHEAGDLPASDQLVSVIHVGASGLVDIDGTYDTWFARHDAMAALVRPDGYVFGVANTMNEAADLLAELNNTLQEDTSALIGGSRDHP